VAGAVLTGGRSSRMGRDKALIEIDGLPLALRVARVLADAGAGPVVAIGGDGPALEALGLRWVPDHHPGAGPLGGLLTAFARPGASIDVIPEVVADVIVVAATDLPDVSAEDVRALLGALPADGPDVALAWTGRREPLLGAWRIATCRPVLQAAFAAGERAVHRAVAGLAVVEVLLPAAHLRNVNEPQDLGR
jgi:molybdenum cofactor guanylyltransferase